VKAGFLGLTHLGLVYSTATASRGVEVVQFDLDASVVERLRQGILGISEPGLEELWIETSDRRHLTNNPQVLASCDLLFVVADVSTDEGGRSDLSGVENLIDVAVANAQLDTPIIIRSQVPPGFCRQWAAIQLPMVYHVETLVFASAVDRALSPDRHIIGVGDPSAPLPDAYRNWLEMFPASQYVMSYESAELAKIAINLFLAASVSTTNSLAELCERVGATWDEIAPCLRADARIGEHAYLQPGLGISGGNLERDLGTFVELARQSGGNSQVIESFVSHSEYRKGVVSRTLDGLGLPSGSVVGILGLAYKSGTASTKNSPSLRVIEEHPSLSFVVHDPLAKVVGLKNVSQVSSIDEVIHSCEVLLVMIPCPEYSTLNDKGARLAAKRAIVDPFGVIHAESIPDSAVRHFVLGRPE